MKQIVEWKERWKKRAENMSIRASIFRQFLLIVILLLCFMSVSYGLTSQVVRNLTRKIQRYQTKRV